MLEFERRKRVGNVVSLAQSAAQGTKPLPLLLRLDSFSHNPEPEDSAGSASRFGRCKEMQRHNIRLLPAYTTGTSFNAVFG